MTVGELVAYLSLDTRKFDRGIKDSEREFTGFGSRVSSAAGTVGKVALGAAVGGIAAMSFGLLKGAAAGIQYNASIEQTTIAMGTMLGSTAKAKDLIAEVTTMAAKTPFEFPELADATKKLVAYGVSAKDAVPLLTRLGDVSAALNIPVGELADIYGKIKTAGRATMEDINQLAGRGIPIYASLAKVMGVSESAVRGLVEEGKVGFPEIEKAFKIMTDEGSMFGGMMEKQSASFSGQWGTIKDGITAAFATAIKPAFDWISGVGMPAVVAAMPQIQAVLVTVFAVLGDVATAAASFFGFFLDHQTTAVLALSAIAAGFLAIGTAITTIKVAGFASEFSGALSTIKGLCIGTRLQLALLEIQTRLHAVATRVAAAAQWLWNAALSANPIGLVIIAVAAFVAGLVILYKKNDDVRNAVNAAWSFIREHVGAAVSWVVQKLREFWDWLQKVWNENEALRAKIAVQWGLIRAAIGAVVSAVVGKLGEFIAWVKKVWRENDSVRAAVTGAWNLIKGGVSLAITAILKSISGLLTIFTKVIAGAKDVKSGLVTAFEALKGKMDTIWGGISGVVGGAKNKIVGFVDDIIEAVNWVIRHVPGVKDHQDPLPTYSSGKGGQSASASSSGGGRSASTTPPSIMDNGGTGADEESKGGLSGVADRLSGWVGDMMRTLGIPWPDQVGGFLQGGSAWILDVVKDAVAGLIRQWGDNGGRAIIDRMKSVIGTPYLWGGTGEGGFDCTGLGYWAYALEGHPMPARAGWWQYGAPVSRNDIRPADVLFYYGPNKAYPKYKHVKYYAGDGETIESGRGGVHMEPVDWGGAKEIRRYLAAGGITNGLAVVGELGPSHPEAVIPLTNPSRGAAVLRAAGLLAQGSVTMSDNRRINLYVQAQQGGRVDVKRLWADINAIEGKAVTAARLGRVR